MSNLSEILVTRSFFDKAIEDADLVTLLFEMYEDLELSIPDGELDLKSLTLKQVVSLAKGCIRIKCALEVLAASVEDEYLEEVECGAHTDSQIDAMKSEAA